MAPLADETYLKQTLFAVPLSCESCISEVSSSVSKLAGIKDVRGNLKDQSISVEGSSMLRLSSEVIASILTLLSSCSVENSGSYTGNREGCDLARFRRFKQYV